MRRLSTTRYPVATVRPGASVSVVIPCFNYARFLRAAVDSALTQPDVDVSVIIVDDASTDDSLAVARAIALRDARVTVLANERNSGPVVTFNRGLAAAGGDYLVRLDADDLLTPGSLARAVAVMQSAPRVGLVYGHPIHFTGEDLPEPRQIPSAWLVWNGADWLKARCAAGTNTITSPEVVMRRSVVDVVGGQRDLDHTHDMEMWLRISSRSDVAYIQGVDQAWHREHAQSLSMKAADPRIILAEIRDAYRLLLESRLPGELDAESLWTDARHAVATAALAYAQASLDRGGIDERGEGLREFSLACDPTIVHSARWWLQEWQIRHPRWQASGGRLVGAVARATRRVAIRADLRRWRRTGVYEKLRVTNAGRG